MENGLCAATIASPTYNINVKCRSISLSDATVWRVRTQRRAQNPTNSVIRVSRTRAAHWVASPFLTQFRAYHTIGRWARDTAHHTKYFGFGFIAASQQKTSSKCIHNPNRCGIANKKIFTFFCFLLLSYAVYIFFIFQTVSSVCRFCVLKRYTYNILLWFGFFMFSAGNRLTVQKIKTSSRRGINEKKSQISLFISAIQLFVVFFLV